MHDSSKAKRGVVVGVLAGGHSRRMGEPKALLSHPKGGTLIEHVVRVALEVTPDVVILGQSCSLPSALASVTVLPDSESEAGPLGGLCSLLRHAEDRWAVLLACDLPLLSAAPLRRLLEAANDSADAVVFVRAEPRASARPDAQPRSFHTCCALYHPRVLSVVERQLANGRRALHALLEQIRVTALVPTADEARQLANLNTPEDLTRIYAE